MGEAIIGSEAIAAGLVTRGALRWNYRTIFPDVYVPNGTEPTLAVRTEGAWLWSHRRGVIAGRAASALHGARWVDETAPVELLWANSNPPPGIITRRERIAADEIVTLAGLSVASAARAGLDLGRYLPRTAAVAHLDALARATQVSAFEILALTYRYRGRHGVRRCREALASMNPGAQSPQETRLRLLLVGAGFLEPQTQIPVADAWGRIFAYLDMGWQEVMIAVEYDGEQHRTDNAQYRWDARRLRMLADAGWLVIRVMSGDRDHEVIAWVREAWDRRRREAMAVKRPA